MSRRSALGVLAACLTVVLGACGTDPVPVQRDRVPAPILDADSLRSPERVALLWWQALRARDADTVVRLFTPAARRPLDVPEVRKAVKGLLGRWAQATAPRVLYTERAGDGVTVFMQIEGGELVGRKLIRSGVLMLALPLAPSDGGWLIDNSAWLRTRSVSPDAFREALAGDDSG